MLYSRHKNKLILIPAICLLVGILTILFFPRTYRSEAKLFLQVGRESIGLDPTATTGQVVSLLHSGREDEVSSAMEILRSRGVSEKVVEMLGAEVVLGEAVATASNGGGLGSAIGSGIGSILGSIGNLDPISDREAAMIEIEECLDVSADRKSAVIAVTYSAKSPHLAQKILNAVVEIYPQEYLRIHRNRHSHEFFADQQDLLRSQLEEASAKLRDAKNQMGLASAEDRRTTLEQQSHAIKLEQLKTEQEMATASARIADLQSQLDRIPEKLVESMKKVPNNGADLLRNQFYSLQMQQQNLLSRYNEAHPLVMAITAQVEEAEKVVNDQVDQREEVTEQVNPIHRQLSLEMKQEESRLAGLKSRLAALSEQQQNTLGDLKELNGFAVKLDELTREEELHRNKFMQYAESLEQARIDQQLAEERITNVSIAQAPTLSEKPTSPRKLLVALASLMLAIAGSVTAIMASESLRPSDANEEGPSEFHHPLANGRVHEESLSGRLMQPK